VMGVTDYVVVEFDHVDVVDSEIAIYGMRDVI
jgi:hypothetical protein